MCQGMERHLLLAGGGHAHVEVLRQLAARPLPGWRITLLTREEASPYSGMLPGVAAGLYRPDQALIPAAPLAARAGAALVLDSVTGLDPAARLLRRAGGAPLPYDLLSLDTGATPDLSVPGAAAHAVPIKPIDALLPRIEALADAARPGQVVALAGGGPAGFEMALAFAARLGPGGVRVVLVTGADGLLPTLPARLSGRAAVALARRGVMLVVDEVTGVSADGLRLAVSPPVTADAVLWAAGAAAPAWLAQTGLARDARGFVAVDVTLRSTSHPEVFAAGDVAGFTPPLPKSGVVAVRQGPVLDHNLRARLAGRRLRAYRPQRDTLVLLNLGDGTALGAKWGRSLEGRLVFAAKDAIDRRFVRRFRPQ